MKERYKREQTRLREEVFKSALAIAETEGWSAVSIRRIAGKIEYSTTKIYELFDNKDHLVLELLHRGFNILTERLEEVRQSDLTEEEKAISLARAYCRFAWDHGVYYRIMYGMDGVPFGVKDTWQEGMRIGDICASILSRYLTHYNEQEIEQTVYATWGTLHGISSLFMSGRLYGSREQAEELAVQSVLAIVKK